MNFPNLENRHYSRETLLLLRLRGVVMLFAMVAICITLGAFVQVLFL